MYRDFSEKSKRNMLSLVEQVDNEKLSNFTDWVGDRWLDFEEWIGKLNIRNYINNVNEYHKRVIDKNNTTKQEIEKIFDSVSRTDKSYQPVFSRVRSTLGNWLTYIIEMEEIIKPGNANFDADYITRRLSGLAIKCEMETAAMTLSDSRDISGEESTSIDDSRYYQKLSEIMRQMAGYTEDEDTKKRLNDTAGFLTYLSSMESFAKGKDNSTLLSDIASAIRGTIEEWLRIYQHYDGILSPRNAAKLFKKYGGLYSILSKLAPSLKLGSDIVEALRTLFNGEASWQELVDQGLKLPSSWFDFAGSIIEVDLSRKHLRRSPTAKYEWRPSYSNQAALSKWRTGFDIVGVGLDTLRGGVSRYMDVSEDGTFDMGDMSEVGIYGSVNGLTSVLGKATGGLTDVLGLPEFADDIASGVVGAADNIGNGFVHEHKLSQAYVDSMQGVRDYINDEDNNMFFRMGASAAAGVGMLGAVYLDTMGDVYSTVHDKVSQFWGNMFS